MRTYDVEFHDGSRISVDAESRAEAVRTAKRLKVGSNAIAKVRRFDDGNVVTVYPGEEPR